MAVTTAALIGVVGPAERVRLRIVTVLTVALSVCGGVLAGALSENGSMFGIGLVVAAVLPLLWWRLPQAGIYFLVATATTVEQFRYSIGNSGLDAFTDRIPLFASLQVGAGTSGLVMNPMDITVIVLLLVWLTRGVSDRSLRVPRSYVAAAIAVLVALALISLIRGLGLGAADVRASLWEVRPWIYLGAAYLFASQFLTSRRAIRGALWVFVLGSGFKGIQGAYIFTQTQSMIPRPEAILAHEESFLFGIFVLLTVGLWIFRQRGHLRTVATALLPLVLLADLGNSRRDAFVVLGVGLLVVFVIAYLVLPERRQNLRRIGAGALVLTIAYTAAEWNGSGFTAAPARAVRSVIAPDARDALSNQYRIEEDGNLGYMIRASMPLGTGFGVPIDYGRVAIVNISDIDPFIQWMPHNGVLYVWMRMGVVGEVVLWLFVAAVLSMAVKVARSRDPEVAMIGALAAAATAGWVIMGYTDMGFFWFRMAIAFGVLLGILHVLTNPERLQQPRRR